MKETTTIRPFGIEFLEEVVNDPAPFGCEDKCGDSSGYRTFTCNQNGSIDSPGDADD